MQEDVGAEARDPEREYGEKRDEREDDVQHLERAPAGYRSGGAFARRARSPKPKAARSRLTSRHCFIERTHERCDHLTGLRERGVGERSEPRDATHANVIS